MGLSRYAALAKSHSLSMISGASGADEKKFGTSPNRPATSRWNAVLPSDDEAIKEGVSCGIAREANRASIALIGKTSLNPTPKIKLSTAFRNSTASTPNHRATDGY